MYVSTWYKGVILNDSIKVHFRGSSNTNSVNKLISSRDQQQKNEQPFEVYTQIKIFKSSRLNRGAEAVTT